MLRLAEEEGRRYAPEIAREAMDDAGALLKTFIVKIYKRMVVVDRAMRGKGFPQSVEPYDASQKVGALHGQIDEQVASFKGQVQVPTRLRKLSATLAQHKVLVNIVVALVSVVVGAVLGATFR